MNIKARVCLTVVALVPAFAHAKKLGNFDRLALMGQAAVSSGNAGANAGGGIAIDSQIGALALLLSIQPGSGNELIGTNPNVVWTNVLNPTTSQSAGYLDVRVSPWHSMPTDDLRRWIGFRGRAALSWSRWKVPESVDSQGRVVDAVTSGDLYASLVALSALYYWDITSVAGIDRDKWDLGISVDLAVAWHHLDGDAGFVSARSATVGQAYFNNYLGFEPTVGLWFNQVRLSITIPVVSHAAVRGIGGFNPYFGVGIRGDVLDLVKALGT